MIAALYTLHQTDRMACVLHRGHAIVGDKQSERQSAKDTQGNMGRESEPSIRPNNRNIYSAK